MQDYIVYKSDLYEAEHELAIYLCRFLKSKQQAVAWKTTNLLYKQPEAVVNACTNSLSILTGPPGTGKTTTLKNIVASFLSSGMTGNVVCPYGKAAKRADEVINANADFTSRVRCSTVHSFLEFSYEFGGFRYNRTNKIKADFVIIDEFSTLDCSLARDLLEAIDHKRTRVILCGDQYQLPSVGPGNVARDLIACGLIPSVELDIVLRTGANSGITHNANRILKGYDLCKEDPNTGEVFKDFFFVQRKTPTDSLNSIIRWVIEDIPKRRNLNPVKDIQVLSPGKNGLIGTKNLNDVLRNELNNGSENSKTISGFRVNDKVINIKNTKQLNIVNGDVGYVKDLVKAESGSHLVIDFGGIAGPNSNGVVDMNSEVSSSQLRHAYALTVHKAQGSEFPAVIMPIHSTHTMLLTRNLVYTGPTRGKELSTLVGDPESMRMAIKNTVTNQRKTRLKELIQKYSVKNV